MSALQIGRYRGGNAAVAPGTASFDEVANIAGLSDPALPQQLRRVRSNGILYRTINTGATWVPVSMHTDVANNAALVALTEMLNEQFVLVRDTDWLWKWTSANGWVAIDTRDAGAAAAAITPIAGWSEPTNLVLQDRALDTAGTLQDLQRVVATLLHDLRAAGYITN